MTSEYARLKIRNGLKDSGVSFGTPNDVEHVVDGYMKTKSGWYVGSGMAHMLKEYHEEVVVLYLERMKLTRNYSEELTRLAEIGKAVEWALTDSDANVYKSLITGEYILADAVEGKPIKLLEAYRKDKS